MNRAFNRLWFSSIASNLADGITFTAVPLLGARLTDDPFQISLISAMSFLPWLVFAIFTGTIVDRVDRRRAIVVVNALRCAAIGVLAVLVGLDSIALWALLLVVFFMGFLETIADNAASSLTPALAGRANLEQANARIEATMTVTQGFIAAPIGGFLFGVTAALPFAIGAVGYSSAVLLALLIPAAAIKTATALAARSRAAALAAATESDDAPPDEVVPDDAGPGGHVPDDEGRPVRSSSAAATGSSPAPPPRTPWWREAGEALAFIVRSPRLRKLWILSVIVGAANAIAQATMVLYVLDNLHVAEQYYGVFTMALAVGGVAGAMSTRHLAARIGKGTTLLVAGLIFGVMTVVVGLAFNPVTGAIAVALWAVGVGLWNPIAMSARQRLIPHHLLGRVHGVWRAVGWGIFPIGSLLGGLIARVNLDLPWYVGGAMVVGAALWASPLLLSFNNDNAADIIRDETPDPGEGSMAASIEATSEPGV